MKFKYILGLLFSVLLILSGCGTVTKPITPEPASKGFQLRDLVIAPTPRPCVDTLAAAKFPGVLSAIPKNYAIGGFAKAFGDFFPVAKKELEAGREYIRVNLIWSDSHTYGDKDNKTIISEARRYQILCAQYPDRTIELAPFTEHNVKDPSKYLNLAQANAPNCKIINSPWKGGISTKYKNEIHGDGRTVNPPYNYSYDGTNSVDSNFVADLQKHSKADIFCAWNPRLNLKWSMKDTTPRDQRKALPSKEMLKSLVYLFTPKGEFNIPGKWLVKSHAEKHNATDTKGDKLLIISPIRQLDSKKKPLPIILKRGGQKVVTLPYYGTYDGGGYRYYASGWGYQYGATLAVTIGNKQYGTINGGFRGPTFRN